MLGTRSMQVQMKEATATMRMSCYVFFAADVYVGGAVGACRYMQVLLVKMRCGAQVTADAMWALMAEVEKECGKELCRFGPHAGVGGGGEVEITLLGKEALEALQAAVLGGMRKVMATHAEQLVEVHDCEGHFDANVAEKALHVAVEKIHHLHVAREGAEEGAVADA